MANKLSKTLQNILQLPEVMLTSSGTAALDLLLSSLSSSISRVGFPNNICFQVILPIIKNGLTPVYLDVDDISQTFSITDKNIENIDLLIYPYNYGYSSKIDLVKQLCKQKNIILVEDICPSLGVKDANHIVGSIGDFCIGSFGVGKTIDVGYGGFLGIRDTTNIDRLSNQIKKSVNNNTYCNHLRFLNEQFTWHYNNYYLNNDWNNCRQFGLLIDVNKLTFPPYENMFEEKIIESIHRLDEISYHRAVAHEDFDDFVQNELDQFEVMSFPQGSIPWRFNVRAKTHRNNFLKKAILNKLPISSWHCSLDRFFTFESLRTPICDQISDEILNFWLVNQPIEYKSKLVEIRNIIWK